MELPPRTALFMKTLTKAALCATYKYTGAMHSQEMLSRWFGRSFVAILLFHRVTDAIPEDGLTVSTARFEQMCRMLRRNFHVVPLSEAYELIRSGRPVPPRTVAITFDDSYRDNLFAARILAEMELPACFFVPTSFLGTQRTFEWDRGLKRMPNLTWDDVREMTRMGFEIGSHTVTHANLGSVSVDQARREICESKTIIENELGRPVRWFAYPFGGQTNFRADCVPLVQEAGYDACFSGFGGFIQPGSKEWVLPREPVPYFRTNINLELHLTGCLSWFYGLKRRIGLMDRRPEAWFNGAATTEDLVSDPVCRGW